MGPASVLDMPHSSPCLSFPLCEHGVGKLEGGPTHQQSRAPVRLERPPLRSPLALTSALTPPFWPRPPGGVNSSAAAGPLSHRRQRARRGEPKEDSPGQGLATREVLSSFPAFACADLSAWNASPAPSESCLLQNPSLGRAQNPPGLGVSVSRGLPAPREPLGPGRGPLTEQFCFKVEFLTPIFQMRTRDARGT